MITRFTIIFNTSPLIKRLLILCFLLFPFLMDAQPAKNKKEIDQLKSDLQHTEERLTNRESSDVELLREELNHLKEKLEITEKGLKELQIEKEEKLESELLAVDKRIDYLVWMVLVLAGLIGSFLTFIGVNLIEKTINKFLKKSAESLTHKKIKEVLTDEFLESKVKEKAKEPLQKAIQDLTKSFKTEGKGLQEETFVELKESFKKQADELLNEFNSDLDKKKEKAEKAVSELRNKTKKFEDKLKTGEELNDDEKSILKSFDELTNKVEKAKLTAEDWFLKARSEQAFGNLQVAIDYYEKSVEINPLYAQSYNNWANTLFDLGSKSRSTEETIGYFKSAEEKYNKAIEIQPSFSDAYSNLGSLLISSIDFLDKNNAIESINNGIKNIKKAIGIRGNVGTYYFNWGNGLVQLWGLNKSKDNINTLIESIEKYRKSIELDPIYLHGYSNLVVSLRELALNSQKDEFEKYLEEGIQTLKESSIPDANYYISQVYALRKDKEEALNYLEKSLLTKSVRFGAVLKDFVWNDYFEDEDFKKLMGKYRG